MTQPPGHRKLERYRQPESLARHGERGCGALPVSHLHPAPQAPERCRQQSHPIGIQFDFQEPLAPADGTELLPECSQQLIGRFAHPARIRGLVRGILNEFVNAQ